MTTRNRNIACQSGFTLIEVMVVVAIIGILTAIAYPAYKKFIYKGRRSEGTALLQAAQLGQEKYRINHSTYASDFSDTAFTRVCPSSGACTSPGGYYSLTATGNASGYTLTVTALGDQANDSVCTTITLTQDASDVTYTPSACWAK